MNSKARVADDEQCPAAELIGLYDELNQRELREQPVYALSRCDDDLALEMLMEIARNGPWVSEPPGHAACAPHCRPPCA